MDIDHQAAKASQKHRRSRQSEEEYRQQLETQAKEIAADNEKLAVEILLMKKELLRLQQRMKAELVENRKANTVGQIIIMALAAIIITMLLKA